MPRSTDIGAPAATELAPSRIDATLGPLFRNEPLREKVSEIASAALTGRPGVDGYSVCLLEGDQVVVAAHAGAWVEELHALQHQLQEGPCWATTRGQDQQVFCENLQVRPAPDAPMGAYAEAAARLGVRAQTAVRIRPRNRTLGTVTVFSCSQGHVPLDADTVGVVGQLVGLAVEQAKLRDGIEQGLRGRTLIGAALGIVMERYQLREDAALRYLKRMSSVENRKLRDLAADIVGTDRIAD